METMGLNARVHFEWVPAQRVVFQELQDGSGGLLRKIFPYLIDGRNFSFR
jgi:hypothetical protein